MSRSFRLPFICAVLALALGPASPSSATTGAPVTADKEGWWSQTGRVAPAELPTTVPEGAIAVSAVGGQAYAVAALGIVLDADKGSTVARFTLTLTEAEGTGAQENAEGAVITACPIVDFFAGDYGGAWADAPADDCDTATAEGVRNDDGTWTFDLAAIANAWLDPFGTIAANGIRFDPGDASFQVSWTGMEDAVFDVSITPPQVEADPFDAVTTTIPGGFTGRAPSSPGSGGFDVQPPPAVVEPGAEVPAAAGEPDTDDDATAVGPAAGSRSRAGDTAGNLPAALVLLVMMTLGAAALIALALGPIGQTRPAAARRSGGVSRALEARTGARA